MAEVSQLLFHQQAGRGARHVMGDPLNRRVRPVRRPERIVHVEIGERGECGRESRIVLLFLGVEAEVLEKDHAAARTVDHLHGILRRRADAVVDELHGPSEQLREVTCDGRQAELRVRLSLRPTEMAGEDDGGAAIERVSNRRQRRRDPRVVGDPAVLQRNVEVDANEDALALEVEVLDRELRHYSPFLTSIRRRSTHRLEYPHSLSYHERTFTKSPSITFVYGASTIDEFAFPLKSIDTSSSSE